MAERRNNNNNGDSEDSAIKNQIPLLSADQSIKFCNQLDTGGRTVRLILTWIMAALVLMSTHGLVPFPTRVGSFTGHADLESANRRAERGWFRDSNGAFRCFSCDECSSTEVNENLHLGHRPDCQYLELIKQLEVKGKDMPSSSEAGRVEKLTKWFFGFKGGDIVRMVQEYGYSKEQVLLAVLKYLLVGSPEEPTRPRPGDIIQLADSLSVEVVSLGKQLLIPLVDKLSVLFSDSAIEAADGSLTRIEPLNPSMNRFDPIVNALGQGASPQSQLHGAMIQQSSDVDSPMCAQCHANQRDRVLLPCGHLRFCRLCTRTFSRCPVCSSVIVCEISVYLC